LILLILFFDEHSDHLGGFCKRYFLIHLPLTAIIPLDKYI